MGGRTPLLVLTFSLAVLSIKLGISHGCRETERKALIDFKRGLHDPSNRLSSWVGEDCCAWEGVGCSNISGHVIKLDLRNSRRMDPYEDCSHQEHLDLSYNCYWDDEGGGSFCLSLENSGWISLLTSLRHLNMTWVSFTNAANWLQDLNALPHVQEIELISCDLGTFPRSLSHVNFTSLTTLDLRGNYINSTIPDWVFNITSLEFLYLGGNDLHGFFPDWLGNIKNLKSLDLSSNSLCGSVPASIGNLSLLQHLSLGSNDLNGTISKGIGQLKSLVDLDLHENSLSLSEDDLANLSSLEYLDISYNFIELNKSDDWIPPFQLQSLSMDFCQIGPTPQFPQWLRTQTTLRQLQLSSAGIKDMFFDRLPSSLEYLDLSYNSLHGSLPASLGNLSMLRSLDLGSNNLNGMFPWLPSGLRYLYLSDNKITGEVPQFFPKLKYLYLSNNSFSGNLSPRITNTMPSLQWFDLSMNNMSGEIPFSYCQLRNLEGLQLYENNLSRVIPNCWKTSSNLLLLDLSSNKLVGGVPDSLCNLQMLESLHLSHNNLSGQIPHCLKSCTELATLDLGHNNFIGNIPTWIGESLLYLKTLSLRSNAFTGSIPQDLSNNNLSGTIPQSFGDFNALKSAPTYQCCYFNNDSLYVEDMWLFIKGSELEYTTRQLSMDTLIDLSNNYLSGNIPEELGNLHGLRSLNLSKNYLIGQIPWSIGRMKQLEVLDLSRNNLSGAIPSDLAALNFLNHLNLSYNNLSGRIPNGNQLQTFTDSSIYAGNPNLCGPPLTKNCTLNIAKAGEEEQNEDSSKSRMETLWLYTSITLGFIIGFWAICGSLLLQQTWRTSYFRAIDNMFDKLYVMMVVTVAKYKRKL
ncbi:LRR receptor-like serine threonine-protein kinase [Musa troglodytarum]|uniref:LRR receptor-like serine threonine-protein kinase n=1 Tax=Musa troglodytarum TaxID=320322 RepID=A0A9E7EVY3_9LILI|nr:LRR receptor-like serine threonine-protein kinase [Musa troglodytarum]